jgi:transposase-like protein
MGGAGKVVEIDETYQGKVEHPADLRTDGKPLKKARKGRHFGPANKRPIIALVERGGSARVFHVAETNAQTVQKIVRDNIDPQSIIHTDASSLYDFAGKAFADHQSVRHSLGEYVKWDENGAIHNNSCENYFSVFKRGMRGVYQWCSEKHLHRYLTEYEYRHNTRAALGVDDEQRAETIIAQVVGKRLTYKAADRTGAV